MKRNDEGKKKLLLLYKQLTTPHKPYACNLNNKVEDKKKGRK